MTDSRAVVASDRLPWLSDEPAPQPGKGARPALGWLAAVAILLVAVAAYWLGQRSADTGETPALPTSQGTPSTTVPLPQPRVQEPVQPEVAAQPMPEVAPVSTPAAPAPRHADAQPRQRNEADAATLDAATQSTSDTPIEGASAQDEAQAPPEPVAPKKTEHPDRPWPVRVTDGASGRLVRVGTFGTARQAKKGWAAIVRNNPSLKRLPALVVPAASLRDGRTYYRLQMGTTSQAHSEVLCQRMRAIGQSCVVIEVYNRGQVPEQ